MPTVSPPSRERGRFHLDWYTGGLDRRGAAVALSPPRRPNWIYQRLDGASLPAVRRDVNSMMATIPRPLAQGLLHWLLAI